MKKLSIFSIAALILFSMWGCEKKTDPIWNSTYSELTTGQAMLKINFVSQYASNPSFQIKVNDVRVSSNITARTPFPGGGFNTGGGSGPDYLSLNPGSSKISFSVPNKGANTDSISLFSTNVTLEAGKFYTLHVTDTGANTKTLLITDNRDRANPARPVYTFVNLMPNVPSADLYFGTTKVASGIAYMAVSDTFSVDGSTTLNWAVRDAGGTTDIAKYSSASTLNAGRQYTGFSSGYKGSTGTRAPFVSFFYVK